jgi:hypothetical protein
MQLINEIQSQNKFRIFLFFALICLYFQFPNDRPDFTKFNADDSGQYLALSKNIVDGKGYTRSLDSDNYIAHTTWPPGMPILLAPAIYFSGDQVNWKYVKFTMIFISLIGLGFLWCYVMRVTNSKFKADFITLFIAFNPYYWHFSRIAMAEIPMLTWIFIALFLTHKFWYNRTPHYPHVAVLGLFLGLGMLLKGTLIGIGALPLTFLLIKAKKHGIKAAVPLFNRFLVFGFCFLIPFILWSMRNAGIDKMNLGFDGINQIQMIIAKIPTDPYAGARDIPEILNGVFRNIKWYMIYNIPDQIVPFIWYLQAQIGQISTLVAFGITSVILFTFVTLILKNPSLFLIAAPIIIINLILANGGSARYWIAISLLLALQILMFCDFSKILKRRATAVIICLGLLINLSIYIKDHESNPYNNGKNYKLLVSLFYKAQKLCGESPKITVLTPHAQTFSLISGCDGVNTRHLLNIVPKYTHIIVSKNQRLLNSNVIALFENNGWTIFQLETPTIEANIIFSDTF